MTREELKAMMPDITEEQITAFLNKHHEELNKSKSTDEGLKNDLDAAKAALEEAKKSQKAVEKELKKLKDEKLTDDEKLAQAIADAENSKNEYAAKLNRLDVEKMFVEAGIDAESYNPILDSIVTADAEGSKKTAESFVSVLKSQKEAVEKAVKESLGNNVPNPKNAPPAGGQPQNQNLTVAEQLAQKVAQQNSSQAKGAKSALDYYIGGSNESN
ncbi:MAG: hypothetical protein ACI4TW_06150 [Prevotella sp.]